MSAIRTTAILAMGSKSPDNRDRGSAGILVKLASLCSGLAYGGIQLTGKDSLSWDPLFAQREFADILKVSVFLN